MFRKFLGHTELPQAQNATETLSCKVSWKTRRTSDSLLLPDREIVALICRRSSNKLPRAMSCCGSSKESTASRIAHMMFFFTLSDRPLAFFSMTCALSGGLTTHLRRNLHRLALPRACRCAAAPTDAPTVAPTAVATPLLGSSVMPQRFRVQGGFRRRPRALSFTIVARAPRQSCRRPDRLNAGSTMSGAAILCLGCGQTGHLKNNISYKSPLRLWIDVSDPSGWCPRRYTQIEITSRQGVRHGDRSRDGHPAANRDATTDDDDDDYH